MQRLLVILTLCIIAGGAIFYAFSVWFNLNHIELSWHGYLAMGLGIVFSFAVGGGLMALMFYSARKGHDVGAYDIIDDSVDNDKKDNV